MKRWAQLRQTWAAWPEDVNVAGEQSCVFEDGQVMGDIGGLALQIAGDAAARAVPLGDGAEDRVVNGAVPDVGLFGEQVAGLTEERAEPAQHVLLDPAVQVRNGGDARLRAYRAAALH